MPAQLVQRPDQRTFVSGPGLTPAAFARELTEIIARADGPICVNCDLADSDLVALCNRVGMRAEFVSTSYRANFDSVLARLPERAVAHRYEILGADQVTSDLDGAHALFALDNALRQHVPGTDGWVGNRDWFDAELASDEFDPTGYLVAQHRATGALVGLIRFWRHAEGPKLGLLAALPQHRHGYLSSMLFRRGLLGAKQWGFDTFTTNTARPALQRRLERSGAVVTGRLAQMRC